MLFSRFFDEDFLTKPSYVYVGGEHGLGIFEVSHSSKLRFVGKVNFECGVTDLDLYENRNLKVIFSVCGSKLFAVDLSDSTAPKVISFLEFEAPINGLRAHSFSEGKFVILAVKGGKVYVVDISALYRMRVVGSFKYSKEIYDVEAKGSYAFLVTDDGMVVLDISELPMIFNVGILNLVGGAFKIVNSASVMAIGGEFFNVVNILPPELSRVVFRLHMNGVYDLGKTGFEIYALGDKGLLVYNAMLGSFDVIPWELLENAGVYKGRWVLDGNRSGVFLGRDNRLLWLKVPGAFQKDFELVDSVEMKDFKILSLICNEYVL